MSQYHLFLLDSLDLPIFLFYPTQVAGAHLTEAVTLLILVSAELLASKSQSKQPWLAAQHSIKPL